MKIGERIRAEREAQKLERKDICAATQIPYPTLAGIENGDQASSTRLHAIAAVLRVSPRWLETGRGPKDASSALDDGWEDVLGYAQAVGLGDGAEAEEYAETHALKFRADSLRRKRLSPGSLAVMYGKGDSMLPRIRSGDAILFDTTDTRPSDEALFVVMCQGINGSEYSAKRCRQFGDQWFFESLNPEGDHNWRKPRAVTDKRHPIEIIGRVRWIGSWEG